MFCNFFFVPNFEGRKYRIFIEQRSHENLRFLQLSAEFRVNLVRDHRTVFSDIYVTESFPSCKLFQFVHRLKKKKKKEKTLLDSVQVFVEHFLEAA